MKIATTALVAFIFALGRFSFADDPVATTAPSNEISVVPEIECGTVASVETLAPDHIAVSIRAQTEDWWMFKLQGVAGRTLTIDLKMAPHDIRHWATLTPVYCEAVDLDDPAMFAGSVANAQTQDVSYTLDDRKIKIPKTDGQSWHFVDVARLVDNQNFTITQSFTADSAYIAERIPCPPGYNDKFIASLAANQLAKTETIGKSGEDRSLQIIEIGSFDPDSAKSKPCVLLAGGEQGQQPDGMWACVGATEFLLGDSDEVKALRQKFNFLIIPLLDPDGTYHAEMRLVGAFGANPLPATAQAYATWFKSWVDGGNRLDLVLELHSPESKEVQHFQRIAVGDKPQLAPFISAFHKLLSTRCDAAKLTMSNRDQNGGPHPSPNRFSGWISQNFSSLSLLYEVNSQARKQHLNLAQTKDTGRIFVEAAGDFLESDAGKSLLQAVDKDRGAAPAP